MSIPWSDIYYGLVLFALLDIARELTKIRKAVTGEDKLELLRWLGRNNAG